VVTSAASSGSGWRLVPTMNTGRRFNGFNEAVPLRPPAAYMSSSALINAVSCQVPTDSDLDVKGMVESVSEAMDKNNIGIKLGPPGPTAATHIAASEHDHQKTFEIDMS
jgi:hypothetical protein